MTAIVDTDKCEGSGECVEVCPTQAIELKDGVAAVNPDLCGDCAACQAVCPTNAITV